MYCRSKQARADTGQISPPGRSDPDGPRARLARDNTVRRPTRASARITTDNGNVILDIHGLQILDPVELETTLNQITGVVMNGLFARRGADILLLSSENGIQTVNF